MRNPVDSEENAFRFLLKGAAVFLLVIALVLLIRAL